MTALDSRVAGAPITWGVCEVPGWGYQLDPERVLAEMAAIGLTATELGPDGYLASDPARLDEQLGVHGLKLIAGFAPIVLHDEARAEADVGGATATADLLGGAGAGVLVLAAATGEIGYDSSVVLGSSGWSTLARSIDRVIEIASERGLTVALHPHFGTMVERPEHVERILEDSAVELCLDTGHLALGGADPTEIAVRAADRIAHVHLKDIDADLAEQVRSGHIDYYAAVRKGLYRPLGDGDVAVADVVRTLEDRGYDGWYVLEQDTVLDGEPLGGGPAEDAAASIRYLRSIFAESVTGGGRREAARKEEG